MSYSYRKAVMLCGVNVFLLTQPTIALSVSGINFQNPAGVSEARPMLVGLLRLAWSVTAKNSVFNEKQKP